MTAGEVCLVRSGPSAEQTSQILPSFVLWCVNRENDVVAEGWGWEVAFSWLQRGGAGRWPTAGCRGGGAGRWPKAGCRGVGLGGNLQLAAEGVGLGGDLQLATEGWGWEVAYLAAEG